MSLTSIVSLTRCFGKNFQISEKRPVHPVERTCTRGKEPPVRNIKSKSYQAITVAIASFCDFDILARLLLKKSPAWGKIRGFHQKTAGNQRQVRTRRF
jgi:hypothetical protein